MWQLGPTYTTHQGLNWLISPGSLYYSPKYLYYSRIFHYAIFYLLFQKKCKHNLAVVLKQLYQGLRNWKSISITFKISVISLCECVCMCFFSFLFNKANVQLYFDLSFFKYFIDIGYTTIRSIRLQIKYWLSPGKFGCELNRKWVCQLSK